MKQDKRVGGSLERALNDNHAFNPMDVLKEGVRLTKQSLPSLFGAVIVALAIFTVVLMLILQLFVGTVDIEDQSTVIAMLLVQVIVMPPLFAAVHMMGIHHSVGKSSQVQDVFMFIKQPFPFILVALITQLISQLAAGLLPGLLGLVALGFISITLSMAIPLAAEYKLSPWQAIRCSFIAVVKRFVPFFGVYAAMFGLFVLGILTFGLALIFVVPLFYNVKGIMYRDIFGVATDGAVDDDTEYFQSNNGNDKGPQNSGQDTWDA